MLNKKETYILIAIIIVLIGGFVVLGAYLKKNPQNKGPALPIDAITSSDWVKGDKSAKIVLIEYSDFQCPACAVYQPIVKRLSDEFGNKMAFAYRHFPLSQHQNARLAATASETGGRQNKFWEMHDLLFENQENWSDLSKSKAEELFVKYAETLGLNIEQFKNDLDSNEIKNKVNSDLISGETAKVNSTPTFFLNGKKIQPRSYEEFREMILSQIDTQPDKQ
ncbi:MAG: thioredoxin domain-containing protein [Patescibacteria group bacterium]